MPEIGAPKTFDGRTAMVTGAAQGIGLEIARQLADAGARVVFADISAAAGAEVEKVRSDGHDAIAIELDVTDEDSVGQAFDFLAASGWSPDILVNNAGISQPSPTVDTTLERWSRVLAVNLTGPFLCSRAALPGMRERQWGRIIMMSSFNAKSSPVNGDNASYAASKAGLTGLVHNLAVEFGPDQVTVNAIAPGIVDTALLRGAHPPERLQQLKSRLPVGRFTTPSEIAATAVFLASDAARSITGEIVNVNGGLYFD